MNTLTKFLTKHKNVIIVLVCVFLFLLHIIFGFVYYETNDDEILNLIAVGAFTPKSEYLIYINILLGWAYKFLYQLVGSINWYLWIQLFLNLISIMSICLVITKNKPFYTSLIITFVVNVVLIHDYYSSFQYTKNASLYAICGWILIYDYFSTNQKSSFVIGIVLQMFSILLRENCYLFALPFGIVFITNAQLLKNSAYKRKLLITISLSIIIILSCKSANQIAYNSEEWSYFTTFNHYRTESIDYFGHVDYDEYQVEFLSKNILKTEYELMLTWDYGDTEVYTVDFMMNVAELENPRYQTLKRLPNIIWLFIRHMGNLLFNLNPFAWSILAILVTHIYRKKLPSHTLLIYCVLFLLEYFYLYYLARVTWRVEIGIWISILLYYCIENSNQITVRINKRNKFKLFLLSVVLLFNMYSYISKTMFEKNRWLVSNYTAFYQTIRKEYPNKYYVGDVMTFFDRKHVPSPMGITTQYKDLFINFQEIGSWWIPSPTGEYFFRQAGIDNPVGALVKKDNVYLVCNDDNTLSLIERFLQEEYKPSTQLVLVDTIDGMQIYKAQ